MNAKNIRRRANAWRNERNEWTNISNHEKNKKQQNTRAKKIIITTTNKQHSSKLAFAHNIQQMRLLLLWLLCTAATTTAALFSLICLVLFLCTWPHFPQFIYFPSVIPPLFLSFSSLYPIDICIYFQYAWCAPIFIFEISHPFFFFLFLWIYVFCVFFPFIPSP